MPLLETWQEIGPHRVRTEEDVIFLQVVGNLSMEETRAICALSEAVSLRSMGSSCSFFGCSTWFRLSAGGPLVG